MGNGMKKKHQFYSVELETWASHENNDGGFTLHYHADIGTGTVTFFNKKGKLMMDNEHTSNEFVDELLAYFYSTATVQG